MFQDFSNTRHDCKVHKYTKMYLFGRRVSLPQSSMGSCKHNWRLTCSSLSLSSEPSFSEEMNETRTFERVKDKEVSK